MQNILQVITFNRLFWIKQLQEVLHELRCDIDFELADFDRFVDNELEEEFVDALEVRPRWVHLFFLVNTGFRHAEVAFFNVGEGAEDVLFDHGQYFVEVGDNQCCHRFLVLQHPL